MIANFTPVSAAVGGALIGLMAIGLDEALRGSGRMGLPPLAVGMGMYLPMSSAIMVVTGAVLGHFYNRWALRRRDPAFAERIGVLTATGLIVGDSLFQVLYAGVVAGTGNADILEVVPLSALTVPLGFAVFGVLIALSYARMVRAVSS